MSETKQSEQKVDSTPPFTERVFTFQHKGGYIVKVTDTKNRKIHNL